MPSAAADALNDLQSLLLFQSIAQHGADHDAFDTISAHLRQNPVFSHAHDTTPAFDVSPEFLKDVYLRLLKDEAKREFNDARDRQDPAPNGTTTPSSPRKRKLKSPVMPTIEEAGQHVHLVPRIIPKLYATYRSRVIQEIRREEQTYDGLLQELHEVEESERTAQQAQQAAASSTSHPAPSAPSPNSPRPSSRDAARASAELRKNDTKIDTIMNHDSPAAGTSPQPNGQPPALPSQAPRPAPPQRPKLPQIAPAQRPPGQPLASPYESAHATFSRGSPAAATSPYVRAPSNHSHSPTLSYPPAHRPNAAVNLASPHATSATSSQAPSVPATPPYSAPHDASHPGPLPPSSTANSYHAPPPRAYAQAPSLPPASTSPAAPYPPSAAAHAPPSTAPPASRAGGVMLPPFQVQTPGSAASSQTLRSSQALPQPSSRQYPAGHQAQATSRPPVRRGPDALQLRTSELSSPQTPVRASPSSTLNGPPFARLHRSDIMVTPGSSTGWKALPFAASGTPASRPQARSISPLSDAEAETTARASRVQKLKPPRGVGRPRQSRGASKTPSTAALSAPDRTRSQSLMSHADEMSVDESAPVKDEVETPTADDAGPRTGRPGRRGAHWKKRKRAESVDDKPESPTRGTPDPLPVPVAKAPQMILCVKHFNKIAEPIVANIRSHKHGSIFERPIKEKDAEGYSSIIKRPQDLKSIKHALSQGAKAVTAALAGDGGGAGSPGAGHDSNTVTLPASERLMPPRAIVNAAQLEQELMRMFANAVMFNPGEDELVGDAREMFEHAVQILDEWRQSEALEGEAGGEAEGEEEEEAADEEAAAASSKRRRL